MTMSRSKMLKIRLTESEFKSFRKTAEGAELPMSDLARSMLIGVQPQTERRRRFVFHPVDPALLRQVSAIGNNLNQLAAWANSPTQSATAAAMMVRLIAIERALSDLVQTQTHDEPPP